MGPVEELDHRARGGVLTDEPHDLVGDQLRGDEVGDALPLVGRQGCPLGLVGPAIALHNNETLAKAFPDRFYVSENLRRVVAAKKPAIYIWPEGKPVVDPEVEALFEKPADPVVLSSDEVRERVLGVLADEARRMLDEGVVAAPMDLDLAMITGAGFQFWNGGLTPLLDREGVSEKVTGQRFLPQGAASVPA